MITSTGKLDIGSIQTKNKGTTKSDDININSEQKHGNVNLESLNGNIILTSIDTSNTITFPARAGNVKVVVNNNGVFRATGFTEANGRVSINTTGNRFGNSSDPEKFEDSGIGEVSITANSEVNYFVTGAYVVPAESPQIGSPANIQIDSQNQSLFTSNDKVSGSIGAVIGESNNATLDAFVNQQGTGNTSLFTLTINKFITDGGGGTSGGGGGVEGGGKDQGSGGSQDRKIEPSQNIQDLSNTKQLDQTASTTRCAEGSEKECQKEFNEALNPILDISAIKQK